MSLISPSFGHWLLVFLLLPGLVSGASAPYDSDSEGYVDPTVDSSPSTVATSTTLERVTDPVANDTDSATSGTDSATDDTDSATDGTDSATEGTGSTTDELEETTNETTEAGEELVGDTPEDADESVDSVDSTADETGASTGSAANETEAGTGSTENGTGVVSTVENATGATEATVNVTVVASAASISLAGAATVETAPLLAGTATNESQTGSASGGAGSAGDDPVDESAGRSTGDTPAPGSTAAQSDGRRDGDGSDPSADPTESWSPSPSELTGMAGAAGVAAATSLSGRSGEAALGMARVQVRSLHDGGRVGFDPTAELRERMPGLRDRLWRIGTVFRYSRYDDSDPLEHDGRRAVFEAVESTPGVYLSAIDERTDGSLSTVRHHLRVLEDEGLVAAEKIRGKRRFFPVDRDGEDPALISALDDSGTRAILEALADLRRAHGGRLADELDRDPSTITHHLQRLESEGLVEREREGRAVVNSLAPSAERVLVGERVIPNAEAQTRPSGVADD